MGTSGKKRSLSLLAPHSAPSTQHLQPEEEAMLTTIMLITGAAIAALLGYAATKHDEDHGVLLRPGR